MASFKVGDRVTHNNGRHKFGSGTIIKITSPGVAMVRFDRHSTSKRGNTNAVNITSLKPL